MSSCLLGCPLRYNGADVAVYNTDCAWLLETQHVIPLCPEVSAGLPVPRVPAEIQLGGGEDVLAGKASVAGSDGMDMTGAFVPGGQLTLRQCREPKARKRRGCGLASEQWNIGIQSAQNGYT